MSTYTINWQGDGQGIPRKEPIILPQKLLDSTSTSITLTGRGVNNYGEIQQENFLRLMENFASSAPPSSPTIGQLWWNTAENILYIHVDELTIGDIPLYYPQSPARWAQIFPSANTFAGIGEYNAIGLTINKIIGTPSTEGAEQFGWGQNDLVPVYDNVNTLSAGFSPLVFPPAFDNNAWVILLSRIRKALRHIGVSESAVPPVGLINDGRPIAPGNALANTYNSHPTPGSLPNYGAGWNGLGPATMGIYYGQVIAAISTLQANRFNMAAASSQIAELTSHTRATDWASTLTHNIDLTFASEDAAKAYFNSGGGVRFAYSHTPTVANTINSSWRDFLNYNNNMVLDYRGMKKGSTYYRSGAIGSPVLGFYNLTSVNQVLFRRNREEITSGGSYSSVYSGIYSQFPGITDGAIQISGRTSSGIGGTFVVNLTVEFIEAVNGSEVIRGTTSSAVWGIKANSVNTNQPGIAYPTGTSAGTFAT